jgi:hypothetical protein
LLCYGGVLDADSLPLHTSSSGGCGFGFRVTARHGSGRRRGVGFHGPSRTTAGGGVVEDAGSAVARPVDAPEPHGSVVLGVVVAPLVSDGFLLARPSSTSTLARRRPASLPARWRSMRHDTGGSARWRLAPASSSRLRKGGASTARTQASLLLSFPLLYPSFLHGDGSEEPKGRDPKRDLVCSRGLTWGFATRGGHSDRESAWARAVPSPFAFAAKAQGAERR